MHILPFITCFNLFQICVHWLKARQDRDPPEGAPVWWGCPRGKDCNFAHGEKELRGQVLKYLL